MQVIHKVKQYIARIEAYIKLHSSYYIIHSKLFSRELYMGKTTPHHILSLLLLLGCSSLILMGAVYGSKTYSNEYNKALAINDDLQSYNNIAPLANDTDGIAVTLPSSTTLNIEPATGGAFNKQDIDIMINAHEYIDTYSLDMYAYSPDTTNVTTDLVNEKNDTYKISTIQSTSTEEDDDFTANSWGYTLDGTNYLPITTTSMPITNSKPANSTNNETISFGVKVDETIPTGTYSVTLNFLVTATMKDYEIMYGTVTGIDNVTLDNTKCTTPLAEGGCKKSLMYGRAYSLSAEYRSYYYEFSKWDLDGPGSIAASTNDSTTFTVGLGPTTIIPSVSPICPTEVTGKTIDDLSTMQDFFKLSNADRASVINSMAAGYTYTLPDSRDGQDYTIGRLADCNVWMLDNLNLGKDSTISLTSADTNLDAETQTTDGANNLGKFTLPALSASVPANDASNAKLFRPTGTAKSYNISTNTWVNITGSDAEARKGILYNYAAASAGTVSDSISGSTSSEAKYDVCPKGWHLPSTNSATSDFGKLAIAYGGNTNGTSNFDSSTQAYKDFNNAFHTTRSGYFLNGSFGNVGSGGYFLASSPNGTSNRYSLSVSDSNVNPASSGSRYSGLSVRCVLSAEEQVPPSLSVTFDESQVDYVEVKSGSASGETVATIYTDGGVTRNVTVGGTYYLKPTYKDGYILDSWSQIEDTVGKLNTEDGTCGEVTASYTIADGYNAANVTAQSALTLTNGSTMQSLATVDTNLLRRSLKVGDTYTLTDSRGGTTNSYRIAKLADCNIWMLDNLALGNKTGGSTITLSHTDTNIESTTVTKDSGGSSHTGEFILPVSSTSGFSLYDKPMINAEYKGTNTANGFVQGDYGVYYNYCAASAGTYCYASNAGVDTPDTITDSPYDICPKGWRMPTGGNTSGDPGEYQKLYNAYSVATTGVGATQAERFIRALQTPLSGYFDDSSQYGQGTGGRFWSSTYNDGISMYRLYVLASSVGPAGNGDRSLGLSVRCVLK